MTKTKTLCSLGVILSSLCFSYTALAHSGMEHSANMHSILHMIISMSVGLAIMTAGFLLLKSRPKGICETIKQRVTK